MSIYLRVLGLIFEKFDAQIAEAIIAQMRRTPAFEQTTLTLDRSGTVVA
jgi:hypothetical protein